MLINTTRYVAVIDDDSRARESIAGLRASIRIDSHTSDLAKESLVAEQMKISCCLFSDPRRPRIDGWELQKSTVANLPNLPIIFISAHKDDLARRRALVLGAIDPLHKPFDREHL